MPLMPGTDSPNRLRLGQGIPGGARGLPGGQAAAAAPNLRIRPLAPRGYATDVTPLRPMASAAPPPSTEGHGAALLSRGWPSIAAATATGIGRGEKKALKILADPDHHYDPKDMKSLQLALRPGPNVQSIIDSSPILKQNQRGLIDHVVNNGLTKLPAQDLIKTLHSTVGMGKMDLGTFVKQHHDQIMKLTPEAQSRLSAATDVAIRNAQSTKYAAGLLPQGGGWLDKVVDNAINQGFETATGMVPGAVQAIRHPVGTAKAVGSAEAKYYSPLVHGDLHKFGQNVEAHPLTPFFDAAAAVGAGVGVAGKVGAASDAVSALRTVGKVEEVGNTARIGGRLVVRQQKDGNWLVQDGNSWAAVNLPSKEAAIAHAQSLATGGLHGPEWKAALKSFSHPMTRGKTRGSLLDAYDKFRGNTHDLENENIIKELKDVADNPNLRLSRRGVKEVVEQTRNDFNAELEKMRAAPGRLVAKDPEHFNRVTATIATGAAQSWRELLSAVRTGAIYLRPAYLPNNWAGNTFMNLTDQGFLAPINLAKSVIVHNHMDPRNLAMMRKAMGQTPAEAGMEGTSRGLIGAAAHPLVEQMGRIADQPFRDSAFLHEARRMGYRKLSDVDGLFNRARGGDEAAYGQIANMARRAQEEVVKFKHLNGVEKEVASNLMFVYNWMKGSTRYMARFPLQHPIQTAAYNQIAPVGNRWVQKKMGGVPWFMLGSIPVGKASNGDPILINPFALNPLGSGLDVARAAMGTYKALFDPKDFNKYSDPTVLDLTNPVVQEVVKGITGGKVQPTQDIEQQIAPLRLGQDLAHPGRGQLFPMTKEEALGHYVIGSMFPRRASQVAIESSLEREARGNPVELFHQQLTQYEKSSGNKIPPSMQARIKGDIESMQEMKDFSDKYARDHGSTGFKNMPPANKAEAALQFLESHSHLSAAEIQGFQAAVKNAPNDAVLESLANAMFGATGIGQYKREWDRINATRKRTTLTPKRG